MLLNVCNFWRPGQIGDGYPPLERSAYATHEWAPEIAESWRTDTDIGFTRDVVFANVLRNLDSHARHPETAGPGHFNDPGHIVPELGLSEVEARTQFTMWAMVAAPLVIGADVRELSPTAVAMHCNPEVIAVDQGPLGIQGTPVPRDRAGDVWLKPLGGGDCAIALLNRDRTSMRVTVQAGEIGLGPETPMHVRDLWTHEDGLRRRAITDELPAHGATLYRISAGKRRAKPPRRPASAAAR